MLKHWTTFSPGQAWQLPLPRPQIQARSGPIGRNAVSMLAIWLQTSGSGGLLGGLSGIPILLLFFAAMYFLMIAPNQKKQKQWQAMLDQLKNGDRVTTSGGIRGVVLQVKDDSILLRVAPDNLKLEFVKSAISSVTTDDEKK